MAATGWGLTWLLLFAPLVYGQSYDSPAKKEVVDLGPSPYYQPVRDVRNLLTCYYYPNFMVKEVDSGQKGADNLSIVPIPVGSSPNCTRERAADEIRLHWPGYFGGVKGPFVVLESADGTDGGMPFGIFDSRSGKRLFEDSAFSADIWNAQRADRSPFDHMQLSIREDGGFTLRYLRVRESECDLHAEAAKCWHGVTQKFGIAYTTAPQCFGYENASGRVASVLAYPVEVTFTDRMQERVLEGPLKCWPAD